MRVYLDMCCLNRPFDDQRQARIRLEAEAVILFLESIGCGGHDMVSSEILELENDNNPDVDRRNRVRNMLSMASAVQIVGTDQTTRANTLALLGFGAYDALHIACAESAGADVLLTTDDQLLKRAEQLGEKLHVTVCNPVLWLEGR